MKKNITFLFIFLFFLTDIKGAQKNMTKLVGGTTLTCMGAMLTYWGFSLKSVSKPKLTMISFTWTKNFDTTWDENYSGTIRNSGNVDLSNIKLSIVFKDTNGTYITTQKIDGPVTLKPGANYNFSNSYDTGSVEPGFVSVSYSADFTEMFENRDLVLGTSGIAIAACGIFFVVDYFFDFTEPLKKKNISLEITPCFAGIKFVASKIF